MFKKKKVIEEIRVVMPEALFKIDPMEEAYMIVVTKKIDDIVFDNYPVAVGMWLDRMVIEFKKHNFSTLNRCIKMFGYIEVSRGKYQEIMDIEL